MYTQQTLHVYPINVPVNGTSSIINTRRAQQLKLEAALQQLTLERDVITSKCLHAKGDNCNEGCEDGYIGTDRCVFLSCFGVVPSNASVCSGHGTCIGVDKCNCTYPYFGSNCQSFNIVNMTSSQLGFKYSDGSYARSCNEYRNPTFPHLYNNEGSGLYQIMPGSTVITVYCDMTTDGGGWTLFAGIKGDYKGFHFHVFDDNTAVDSSSSASFHIKTRELVAISKEVRAATDSMYNSISSFYTSVWAFSAKCYIPDLLRADINYTQSVPYTSLTNFVNPDREANCTILTGTQVYPTHLSYCKASNGQPIGFRMGRPWDGPEHHLSHMAEYKSIFTTFTYFNAPEGNWTNESAGVCYNGDPIRNSRNGVLFLR